MPISLIMAWSHGIVGARTSIGEVCFREVRSQEWVECGRVWRLIGCTRGGLGDGGWCKTKFGG